MVELILPENCFNTASINFSGRLNTEARETRLLKKLLLEWLLFAQNTSVLLSWEIIWSILYHMSCLSLRKQIWIWNMTMKQNIKRDLIKWVIMFCLNPLMPGRGTYHHKFSKVCPFQYVGKGKRKAAARPREAHYCRGFPQEKLRALTGEGWLLQRLNWWPHAGRDKGSAAALCHDLTLGTWTDDGRV